MLTLTKFTRYLSVLSSDIRSAAQPIPLLTLASQLFKSARHRRHFLLHFSIAYYYLQILYSQFLQVLFYFHRFFSHSVSFRFFGTPVVSRISLFLFFSSAFLLIVIYQTILGILFSNDINFGFVRLVKVVHYKNPFKFFL